MGREQPNVPSGHTAGEHALVDTIEWGRTATLQILKHQLCEASLDGLCLLLPFCWNPIFTRAMGSLGRPSHVSWLVFYQLDTSYDHLGDEPQQRKRLHQMVYWQVCGLFLD